MAKDYGECLGVRVVADATAGMGIANRLGLGRVRHLHTQYLWVQQKVKEKVLQIAKISGHSNTADLGTKYLDRENFERHRRALGIRRWRTRRARGAAAAGG